MAAAKKEIDDLEKTRIKLQAELNSKEMVLVPAAKVSIGTSHPTHEDENPEHQVTVNSFYLDKTEITNLQYKEIRRRHRTPLAEPLAFRHLSGCSQSRSPHR